MYSILSTDSRHPTALNGGKKKSGSNAFEPEPNLNLGFRFEVQQVSEPDRKFEFGVQGKEALNRTEPNFPITMPSVYELCTSHLAESRLAHPRDLGILCPP